MAGYGPGGPAAGSLQPLDLFCLSISNYCTVFVTPQLSTKPLQFTPKTNQKPEGSQRCPAQVLFTTPHGCTTALLSRTQVRWQERARCNGRGSIVRSSGSSDGPLSVQSVPACDRDSTRLILVLVFSNITTAVRIVPYIS